MVLPLERIVEGLEKHCKSSRWSVFCLQTREEYHYVLEHVISWCTI
jgi:hypothetical protein